MTALRRAAILIALLIGPSGLVPCAAAQTTPFAGCGTIVPGVTCPKLFQADAGGLYILQNLGSSQLGDRVYVTGLLDPGCITICQQGNGCIGSNTLGSCDPSTHFCFGDGTGGACPCGNNGAAGRGCASSANASGAVLSASGSTAQDMTSGTDTIVLAAAGMLPTANAIYLQGDAQVAPVTFGDGSRCAGGNLKRLALKTSVGGASQYPQTGDLSVSQRSAALGDPILNSGATRHYQTYYRDPDPVFCPSPPGSTWNVTGGLTLVW